MEIVPSPTPLADAPPKGEAKIATAGAANTASRMDHEHPRLTSATSGTLNASGEATVMFTRTFDTKPSVALLYAESADGQPIVFKIKSWLGENGLAYVSGAYGGCVIKGYRSQTIPTNLVSLLIGGVFNLFAGSAAGVEYSAIALQTSAV
ncbi:hypothetical protein ACQKKX_02465 [Neorhizobium sp. NPDC001467]|uniref:hypothetical protein n=1 Tax=Neorhizobium sp. NPDC001467 TaxID=3390595 RepID=UPI003CFDD80B